jgi:hypothetical protein
MGMSSDYKLAIKCGSTFVRIGSSIFSWVLLILFLFEYFFLFEIINLIILFFL